MDEMIEFCKELAEASGEIIHSYFRTDVDIDIKDDTTPVTIADRKAEERMRQMIQLRYPDHGIIGEEFDDINPDAEYQWALDPIDGTKTFLTGTYLFGTLIALLREGRPILGAINNPIVDQFLVGNGEQTWLNGKLVRVRSCKYIEDATLLTTSPLTIYKYHNKSTFDGLVRRVNLYRTWGDCHGYYLVATGYADIMIDGAMHFWDVAALVPIIEGAGGVISDYFGGDPLSGKGAIATAGDIHEEVINLLNP